MARLLPFSAFSAFLAAAISLVLLARVVMAQTYPACRLGDAACAPDSNLNSRCCPSGASVSSFQLNGGTPVVTCTGGTPAGCAADGHAQPTFNPCSSSTSPQSCPSGSRCVTGSIDPFSRMGILGLGHPLCPSDSSILTHSMRVTTTEKFEYGGGVDYGPSIGLRAMMSATPSKCYELSGPYIAMARPNLLIRCANNQQCSYHISSSITCVPTPSDNPCLVGPVSSTVPGSPDPARPCAGNARAITASDGNQYCCSSETEMPSFGASAYCTCGQLQSLFS